MTKLAKKKVIKIKGNLFIHDVLMHQMVITDTASKAVDISDWTYDKLSKIMGTLADRGLNPKVVEVPKGTQ